MCLKRGGEYPQQEDRGRHEAGAVERHKRSPIEIEIVGERDHHSSKSHQGERSDRPAVASRRSPFVALAATREILKLSVDPEAAANPIADVLKRLKSEHLATIETFEGYQRVLDP